MRVCLSVFAVPLFAFKVSAAALVPGLPPPSFADREVSLDAPLAPALSVANGETFRLTFAFEGAASNNVQFAFGKGSGGSLPASETAFIAGWDRGSFFLRPRGLTERFETPDAAEPGPQTLTLQMRRTAAGALTNAVFTVQGRGVAFAFPSVPEWLDPAGWDALRVTSRGTGAPAASVDVRRFKDGATVILK
ncbi:MAG: hypothetical protein LBW77_00905 [Verrucomicrobiota bacterium]|jgi:hypothetical protein|nr:hypothetical protein [Verrucomicrobiota bacterium]